VLFGLIHAALLAGAWLSIRFAWRMMQELVEIEAGNEAEVRRVLLVSAGVECVHLLRGLEGSTGPIRPIGILDFNPQQVGREVRGLPILGTPSQLDSIVARLAAKGLRPEEMVLTEPLPEYLMVDVIERAVAVKLKVSKLPSPGEAWKLIGRGLSPTEPITLRTIVGREQLEFDRAPISTLIAGKRILVTGAGGSIGSQLVKLIAGLGPEQLCLVENGEYNLWKIEQDLKALFPDVTCTPRLTDIRDANRLRQVFAESRPDLVFHAAALKHVPIVEANMGEGVMTNIIGTRNVADASLEAGVQAMVQVSTDKAVMPTSVMGATKRVAEIYCQSLDLSQTGPRFITVRFGNVLGSSGSVVPIFEQQILAGGPVTVTHPRMERFFMTIAEACELILHSAAHGARDSNARGVINVLDMGKSVKILDIARRMILLHGKRPDEDIKITFTGVRPGEKLFEDLFNDGEVRLQSSLVGVHTARSESVPLEHINEVIARLEALAAAGDNEEIMKTLGAIVPGYLAPKAVEDGSVAA
jgi:O-antigen biosynthesis protein WbqV